MVNRVGCCGETHWTDDGLSDIVVGTPEHIEGDFETGMQPGGIVLLY